MTGEATQLTTCSELQVENQISTCSKAEERTDNKGEFKKKSLLYQLIITGPNVTNDFELCSSEICLLPVERREWGKLTITNFSRLRRKLVWDRSTMAHHVLFFFWVKPLKQRFHYKRPHTIPLLYSGSEHCPLQMPPNGFLVSQITTSQWTKT